MYIDTASDLESFCARASASHVLAVDTEFIRDRTFRPQLCLVQLATHEESCVVDPILIKDLSSLARLFEDEKITKVFHACTQDIEVINVAMGCVPRPIFDTQVAAAFLGCRLQLGYGAVVERYCGVHLAKADSLTDWARRPLDEEQLAYAEDDVRYLPGIYDDMISQLVEKDRLGWVMPEMDRLTDASAVTNDPKDAYLKLKRSSGLNDRQLAIAREVCAWRERSASRRNIPRKWVLNDEVIVETCKRAPKTADRLRRIRGTAQLSPTDVDSLVAAVKRGLECPNSELPHSKRQPKVSTQTESVVDLMYALVRLVAEKSGVAAQLIATRDDLLGFVASREGSPLSVGWRYDLVGALLERLLAGEIGITVKEGRVELL